MCDLCVAADHARFAITEVKVGRGAPWAAPLPWLVAPRVAMELLVTGDPISAARAFDVGLVNRVVPLSQLHDATQELAETIAANAPLSVAAAKRTVYLGMNAPFEEADALWEPVYLSADAQEGPRAFAEKRRPQWQGQ
jgi:enoyl-CoA hydratase/carnithine racemase